MLRLHDLLDHHADRRPNGELVADASGCLTYAEGRARVNRMANAMVAAGLRKGDRVGLIAKNCADYLLLYFAASKAGVVLVPLNYRLTPGEWAFALRDAEATLVFVGHGLREAVARVRPELPQVKEWISLGGAPLPEWTALDSWVAPHPSDAPAPAVSPNDAVYQMYTSGTTGRPKGAVITHTNIVANVLQFTHAFGVLGDRRNLTVAPLYHVAAALIAFTSVCWGSTVVVHEDFVPGEVVRALSEDRIAFTLLVPAMIQACLVHAKDAGSRTYPHLEHMLYGASPIAEATLRRASEVFGCKFTQGYGMTETAGVSCVLLPEDHVEALAGKPARLASAGRPTLGTELRIVGPDGAPARTGELGEIEIRGPQVMSGYWRLPEATGEAFHDGWLRTGDVGSVDAEGYVYLLDRAKDMILSGGENIYPREVEDVLFAHPAVADAAVIGVPDDVWGESVKAVVVLRPGASATEEELLAHCQGRLAGFKRPRSVVLANELPRNSSGKVLKRVLREPYWAGRSRRVGGA